MDLNIMFSTRNSCFLGIVGCSFLIQGCKPGHTPESSPNIVFILADDLGWNQTSVYGSSYYRTPNIDRLAEEGRRFTNAYAAAAVCSPTRASIMTGKSPAALKLTDFIAGNKRDSYPLTQPEWQKFLPLEEKTLAELCKEKGYATAHFGKWHLSIEKRPPGSLPYNPDKQGFDEHFVTYKPGRDTNPEMDPHNTDTISALSIDFIKRHAEEPFFLMVSFNAIHDPLMDSEARIEDFKSDPLSDKPENNPVIGAMLERLDEGTGRIVKTLNDLGIREKTLLIFYSDNGGKESYAEQSPLRAGKGWLYEGGIRVPLIISWPGKIKQGSVEEGLVISSDFYPTLSSVIGMDTITAHQGVDLLPNLLENADLPARDLFWHYPHYHYGSGMKPASAIRSGNWKLIEWHEEKLLGRADSLELFDLEHDLSEEKNLADSLPGKAVEMYTRLNEWRNQTGADLPRINSGYHKTK